MQLTAIAMMLAAFVLMNLKGLTLRGSSRSFLFWCAALFLSNGLYAIMMNTQQQLMSGAERNEMIILTYLVMAALYAAMQLVRDRCALLEGFRIKREPLIYLLLCCVSATIAAHLMLYVLTLVDASVLYTIDNGGVLLLSVIYSFVLFKERLTPAQAAGVALSALSIVMLSV
ncbi:MAG: EamA family transporter [Clostridia bacterium]|nr:EamA family transporter [Clostridia bacterium]